MIVILRIDAASVGRPLDRVDAIIPIGGQAALARSVAVHNVELVVLISAQFVVETEISDFAAVGRDERVRSEEHTSELQSLMRNSYAVFCLKKKKIKITKNNETAIIQNQKKTKTDTKR